jgi:hypothetical protein
MKKEEIIKEIDILKQSLENLILLAIAKKHQKTYIKIVEKLEEKIGLRFDPLSLIPDSAPLPDEFYEDAELEELEDERNKLEKAVQLMRDVVY